MQSGKSKIKFLGLYIVILIFAFSILNSVVALAQPIKTPQQAAQELCDPPGSCPISTIDQIFGILKKVVQYVYIAFFFVAILFILLAAYNYLFARGDAVKVASAHKELIWASVAIAVALISVGAAQIIQSFISVPK